MMAQRVKALATKRGLSLIPRTLTVDGEIQLFVSCPCDTAVCLVVSHGRYTRMVLVLFSF